MASVLLPSAMFVALLLSLSPPGADADNVTWRKCKRADDYPGRYLDASSDNEATFLNLSNCNLTDVRSGDFYGLPNVDTIWLMYNHIAQLDLVAFRDVPKLNRLALSSNDLHEAPIFDEHSLCPSLITLFLGYNKITEIKHPQTFSGCTELKTIFLNHNAIEYIHPDVFRPLSKLEKLEIEYNRLTTIPENLLMQNVKLDYLSLYKNKISFLPSNFVSKLKAAGAPLEKFYFYDNPWQCACLLELLADVKRVGVREIHPYMEHYYSTSNTVSSCEYFGALTCSRPAPSKLPNRAGEQPLAGANAEDVRRSLRQYSIFTLSLHSATIASYSKEVQT